MRPPRRTLKLTLHAGEDQRISSERELKKIIAGKGKVDTSQLTAVLHKVSVVMADYLDSGKAINIVLNPVEILSAVEAAIREAEGQPSPWPDGADARTFFVHGLYDEIIQQPSNIFETKIFPDGSERYIPIARGTWKACLEQLRLQIVESGLTRVARKKREARRAGRPQPST